MGIPEWMLSIDNRKTKVLHNGACIQFLLHFRGPIAGRIEQDFSRLMSTGKLKEPSLSIPGWFAPKRKSTLGHRQCGTRDPNDKSFKSIKSRNSGAATISVHLRVLILICVVMQKFLFI